MKHLSNPSPKPVGEDITGRKQAEEQLRASEERLRGIFTQTLAGIAETDLTGRFVQVNQRYCEIVGRTAEELYRLRMQDITHPDDLTRNLPLFKRAVTEGVPFTIEKRYVRPDGSLVWVHNSVSLIRDENGMPRHIVAISLDISDRKETEQSLAIRNRQQRAVAALGQFALSEPELKNVFDEAVRSVADTLGNEYCKVLELLPGGDRVLLVSGVGWKQGLVGKATVPTDLDSQAGYTLVTEGPVISRDLRTETRFRGPQLLIDHGVISGMSCIIPGAAGKPWGVLGTHTTKERQFTEDDVNFLLAVANVVSNAIRRSQQESEVRRSEETFAALVEQSPLGIYTVDADFRIANVSAGSAPAFRNVQPVVGRDFAEVMHTIWPEPFASEVIAIFRRVLETGEPYISPGLTEKRKDIGQVESYEWQVNRVTLADGRPGVVCYYFDATRLQQANQALRESRQETQRAREYAEATLRTSPVPLLVLESDLHIVTANEAFYETFHVNPSDTAGRLVYELGNGQWDIPALRQLLEDILSKHSTLKEFKVTHDFQTIGRRTMMLNARRMEVEAGGLERIVLVIEDITQRERAEEQLREQEAQYRGIFESTSDAVLVFDYDGRLIETNPAGCDMHGYSYDEFVGMHGAQFVHPDDHHKFANFVRQVSAGEPFHVEGRHIRKDGQLISIHVNGTSFVFGGRPALLAVVRDVTEEKRAVEALRESEARFRAMADNIPQLAWMADGEGWIFWYNQQWYDYTGTNLEQMQGWGWKAVHHPDHLERVVEKVARHFREGLVWEDTFPLRGKDGRYRWFLSRMTPIRDESGKVVRFFGTNTDVTEQRAAEQTLRETHELLADKAKHLEALVQQRTAKLQNAIGELEAFSYSVAHDLRAPLRAMSGYAAELLKDSGISSQGQTYAERIARAAARLDRLTQEVLSYSKISREDIKLERVDTDKLAHDLVEQYAELVANCKNIEIRSPLPPVLGHESLLAQALSNLLINACKFVAPGRAPKVVVRAETMGGDVRILMEDNGIGIDPRHRERLFKLFGRIHPDDTYPGTGVGLAIVKKATERMGGTVGFESEPGKGSRFWVQLKRA